MVCVCGIRVFCGGCVHMCGIRVLCDICMCGVRVVNSVDIGVAYT